MLSSPRGDASLSEFLGCTNAIKHMLSMLLRYLILGKNIFGPLSSNQTLVVGVFAGYESRATRCCGTFDDISSLCLVFKILMPPCKIFI
jgi:hypothetical protein